MTEYLETEVRVVATLQSAFSNEAPENLRSAVLNLWVLILLGAAPQISCLSGNYIKIHHSSKIAVVKQQQSKFYDWRGQGGSPQHEELR